MLYPKNLETKLRKELFENPSKEYRGTPFWAWNTKMTKTHIDHTLMELKEMGMGGAHIHCRTGMDIPYLGEEFMELVRYSHQVANAKDMLTWLYDEDRWPSGAAGGIVTKEDKYRMRFLVLSPEELPENEVADEIVFDSSAKAVRSGKRRLLAKYEVHLENGYLETYHCIEKEQKERQGYQKWYAYLEISGSSAWFNNQAYLNTLDRSAVERFIEVTHDAYNNALGDSFGTTIPAIFTDEPQFSHKTMLNFAKDRDTLTIPYTDDFEETYQKLYQESFLMHLPEIFWDLPDGRVSVHRYHYHDHVCERFTEAFSDTVGAWCRKHNLLLSGHMMQEPTLYSQTSALGEAMRSYRSFGIPGIDMLCDRRELTTAKQAQSAVHQYNCPGVMSELYGVTNWDFDFRGHKLAGDWQAALGVTVRVHHLNWTSMAGEAKRDYPAPIGYQSPWYKEYSYLEDYFARLNTALTRGNADVKVGVIHPIESYWLYWGTKEHTEGIRKEMDYNFNQLVHWLLYGLIDFDFIAESLLPELQPVVDSNSGGGFLAGAMEYDVIVVPNCITLRRTTLERLRGFINKGGSVIFTGKTPSYIDAIYSEECQALLEQSIRIEFNENDLLVSLSPYRKVDVRNQQGLRTDNMLYQMRNDGNAKWLYLAHSEKPMNPDLPKSEQLSIRIDGIWKPIKYNAMTGEIAMCNCEYIDKETIIKEDVYGHDSLLYYLEPEMAVEQGSTDGYINKRIIEMEHKSPLKQIICTEQMQITKQISYPNKVAVKLSEPNVLLLDLAEYRFDDGAWHRQEEILRIDNIYRRQLNYPMRTEAYAQPWLDTKQAEIKHKLSLRYRIYTECKVTAPALALEDASETTISLNGCAVPNQIVHWYADRDIQTVALPDLIQGENILEVVIGYHSKRNVEAMYLLGDFSVLVAGRSVVVSEARKELAFGDTCMQGLPFYGGNITYEIPIDTEGGELIIEITQFRCPVIKVTLDGVEKGYIALSPYQLNLGKVGKGKHVIAVTAFGNRINTFGAVHNCNHTEHWIGPDAWRSTGASWAYEYQLKKSGILVSPVVTVLS